MLRSFVFILTAVFACEANAAACNITPASEVKLTAADQEVLKSIGKTIELGKLLSKATVVGLFTTPGGAFSLATSDAEELGAALGSVGKIVACQASQTIVLHLAENPGADSTAFFEELDACFSAKC